jgi:hypothetical protein
MKNYLYKNIKIVIFLQRYKPCNFFTRFFYIKILYICIMDTIDLIEINYHHYKQNCSRVGDLTINHMVWVTDPFRIKYHYKVYKKQKDEYGFINNNKRKLSKIEELNNNLNYKTFKILDNNILNKLEVNKRYLFNRYIRLWNGNIEVTTFESEIIYIKNNIIFIDEKTMFYTKRKSQKQIDREIKIKNLFI